MGSRAAIRGAADLDFRCGIANRDIGLPRGGLLRLLGGLCSISFLTLELVIRLTGHDLIP